MTTRSNTSQPIDILDMISTEHDKGYSTIGAKPIYSAGMTLIGEPSTWSRKQKLAYIETRFAILGLDASKDKFVTECMLSRGISYDIAKLARNEGLRLFERNR